MIEDRMPEIFNVVTDISNFGVLYNFPVTLNTRIKHIQAAQNFRFNNLGYNWRAKLKFAMM